MDIKALLLDFDGVINPSERYFSEIYAEKFSVDKSVILEFIRGPFKTASIGKSDLGDLLEEVKDLWKWKGTTEELIQFWLKSDSEVSHDIKDYSIAIRSNGVPVYLATDQEQRKATFIWEELGLTSWMDGKFVSCELGYLKSNPEFFAIVTRELRLEPQEIVFFDDSESKVESAKSVGIKAFLYTDFESFLSKITELGLL